MPGAREPLPEPWRRPRPGIGPPAPGHSLSPEITRPASAPAPARPVPGDTIGGVMGPKPPSLPSRYLPQRCLGRGGMGEVWLVEDRELARPAAVKVIRAGLTTDATVRARLEREAAAMAGVEHPHIIRIYACELARPEPYLVMEFIAGRTLEAVLEKRKVLPVAEVLRLAEELGGALDTLHGRGLFHRDLKPANVMIRDTGGAVLMDLGLVRVSEGTALTATGSLVGTPAYLPPEAALGSDWDARSDLFQLAAILWECLAGTRMVPGRTLDEVIKNLTGGHYAPLPDGLPEGLRAALAKAAATAAAARHPDGGTLAEALRTGTLPARSGALPRISSSSFSSPFAPRVPVPLALAAGFAVLVGVAALWPGGPSAPPAAPVPGEDAPEPPFGGDPRAWHRGAIELEVLRECRIRPAGEPGAGRTVPRGTLVLDPEPGVRPGLPRRIEWSEDGRTWRVHTLDTAALGRRVLRTLLGELAERDPLEAVEAGARAVATEGAPLAAERDLLARTGPWLEAALGAEPDPAGRARAWRVWTLWAPLPAMLRSLGHDAPDLPGAPATPGLPFVPDPAYPLPGPVPDLAPVAEKVVDRAEHGWTLASAEARKLPLGKHSEAMAALRFAWPAGPATAPSAARLVVAVHSWRLSPQARLRLCSATADPAPWCLDFWVPAGLADPQDNWRGTLAVELPAAQAPAPGTPMRLEVVRLARVDAYLTYADEVRIGPAPARP